MRERERILFVSGIIQFMDGGKNCWKELSRIEDNRKNREGKERKKRK